MVCLDTSVLIDYLRGDAGIITLLKSIAKDEKLSTTSITEYELLKHGEKIKREAAAELLSTLKIYYFDSESADEASRLYRKLREQGKEINENDILIAGISFSNHDYILTRDPDFKSIGESNRVQIV
ncbi:MAG: type II toxin-antitoxin system VapC family toxin [Candidatus Micrarchaeota archaeon]|nr:type II toxin-antitoxin system VapC family toxin [Candidatus Micrarchaeota archaeon]MDE1859950.1 type II toxin-antitoxin system VapC family toxin [Candidatus Micrarchaeota archaeon]